MKDKTLEDKTKFRHLPVGTKVIINDYCHPLGGMVRGMLPMFGGKVFTISESGTCDFNDLGILCEYYMEDGDGFIFNEYDIDDIYVDRERCPGDYDDFVSFLSK